MFLKKGQKIDLDKLSNIEELDMEIGWKNFQNVEVDISAFVLEGNNKVKNDDDFIFYNNSRWDKGIIQLKESNDININSTFKFFLKKIPNNISKIAITATIYEYKSKNQNFSSVKNMFIRGREKGSNTDIFRFDLDDFLSLETGLIIGEVYKYNGYWKFNAVASGYTGGLDALCKDFGVTVDENINSKTLSTQSGKLKEDMSKIANISNINEKNNINLSKIELKKKGDKIDLTKKNNSLGKVIVNLNWTRGEKKTGFFGSILGNNGIDLDLGCMYELKNGEKGVIQALGGNLGNYNYSPYINLLGDDRTGDSKEGEFLWINGDKINEVKRILIYSFIYEGVSNWSQADGIIRVLQLIGPEVVIKLSEPRNGFGMCGAVLIENVNNEFIVEKIEDYYKGHEELDKKYGFGFRWVAGKK